MPSVLKTRKKVGVAVGVFVAVVVGVLVGVGVRVGFASDVSKQYRWLRLRIPQFWLPLLPHVVSVLLLSPYSPSEPLVPSVQSEHVLVDLVPVYCEPVHVCVNDPELLPLAAVTMALSRLLSRRSALLLATTVVLSTRRNSLSPMRSRASTVLVDSHATHVPPRLAASASP